MWKRGKYIRLVLLAIVAVAMVSAGTVFAETSNSPHYQASDTQFNSGALDGCSSQYCTQGSVGDAVGGETKSDNNTAQLDPNADNKPQLDVTVDAGESDLGIFTSSNTSVKTATIKVRNYLSSGYTMQITGSPPSYAGHTLTALAIPTASQVGTEQFGINLVDNSSPAIGANPVQVPSGEFSVGAVMPAYATPNLFKYVDGDVIAHSATESGETDYTISIIINVSNATPAGQYSGGLAAVIVPIY